MSQKSSIIDVKLFDSFLRQEITVRVGEAVVPGRLRVYHCGPTVYFYPHIGNMQGAWLADTLVKFCKMAGWDVDYVENITDVGHLVGDGDDGQNVTGAEDKMEKAAKRDNKKVQEIVEHYSNNYREQGIALGLDLPIGRWNPKATEYIEQQMVLALEMLRDGRAYLQDDGIYFDSEVNSDLNLPFKLLKVEDQSDKMASASKKNTVRLITFDIDGVLTRFKVWGQSFEREYGVSQAQLDQFYMENRDLWHGVGDLKERLVPYLKKWNVPLSVEEYLEYWFTRDWEPFEEVWDYARKLKQMGYKIGIASAQESYRREFLKMHHLPTDLFEYFFFSSEIGRTKQEPEFWGEIFEKAGVSPSEVLHIDDSKAVCRAAEQNGANSILYINGETDIALELEKILGVTLKNYTGREIKNQTKNPADFALWKFVDSASLQKWRFADFPEAVLVLEQTSADRLSSLKTGDKLISKWGCPGWHSECVAMICAIFNSNQDRDPRKFSFKKFVELDSNKLNNTSVIDIHLGGEDHIEVHHRNEILQSEALGFHLSKYWVHNRFVLVDGKKMSKSIGNVFTITGSYEHTGFYSIQHPPQEIKDKFKLVNGFDPLAFRLMLFEQNYQEQLNFTWDKLAQSQARLYNLRKEMARVKSFLEIVLLENKIQTESLLRHFIFEKVEQDEDIQTEYQALRQQWLEIAADNLNFSKLLECYQSGLNELSNQIRDLNGVSFSLLKCLIEFDNELLGLKIFNFVIGSDVMNSGALRWQAKLNKEYSVADELRKEVDSLGWQIDDYAWGWGIWWKGDV